MKRNKKFDTKKYVGIAVFSALAYVVALGCNVIPPVAGFLSLDVKDAVIAMASFIFGPISAVIISFIAAFIELVTFSTTGWYGFVMNFVSSAVFSLTASLIYRSRKTLNFALIGFFSAVAATTGVMLLLNIFVTPLYLVQFIGMPEGRIILAEAAIYVAKAPKSNSVICAIDSALSQVRSGKNGPVPDHLKDSHYAGAKQLGHGVGYKYAHDYAGNFVHQEFLPDSLAGTRFYTPNTQNAQEAKIAERIHTLWGDKYDK